MGLRHEPEVDEGAILALRADPEGEVDLLLVRKLSVGVQPVLVAHAQYESIGGVVVCVALNALNVLEGIAEDLRGELAVRTPVELQRSGL